MKDEFKATSALLSLYAKIDAFIRKYYLNRIIKGSILSISLLVIAFLFISFAEYFLFLPSVLRSLIFYGFLFLGTVSLVYWVIVPLVKYFKIGTTISPKQAAIIIGKHFSEVDDKLLGVLELNEVQNIDNLSLIEASIIQKTQQLNPIAFTNAINLRVNYTYLFRYMAPSLMLFFIIYVTNSRIIKEGSGRIIQYNKDFEKEFPFNLQFLSGELEAVQNSDYRLSIKITGEQIPDQLYISHDQAVVKMNKNGKNLFEYTFSNVQRNQKFRFSTSRFNSAYYELYVLKKPAIAFFNINLKYPAYTQLGSDQLKNIGDLSVPEGTDIEWLFNTINTGLLEIKLANTPLTIHKKNNNEYALSLKAKSDALYTIKLNNSNGRISDSINYSIRVIPDIYPSISIDEIIDSSNTRLHYFTGSVSDDYGLKNLYFKYSIQNESLPERNIEKAVPINISSGKNDLFTYYFNFSNLNLKPGDHVKYFFEVWDNDGVNGSKNSRTNTKLLDIPNEDELENMFDKDNKNIKQNIEKSISKIKDLNKDLTKLREDLMQKKNLDWEDKKKISDILNNQKNMLDKLQQLQKDVQNNSNLKEELKQMSPELAEKQKQLNEIAQQVLSPEMQDLMKKIQDLMEKLNKESTIDQLKQNEKQNQQLENQLDKLLSLFKQLEFEQKFDNIKENLKELAKEQQELSNETKNNKNKEDLQKKQEEINKKFDNLKQDLKELNDLNKELDNPMGLPDMEDKSEKTSNELDKSMKEINKGNNSKASESQKNASKNMQEMADAMDSFMKDAQMQQMEEDLQSIRQILENIIKVSFKQEELMNKLKKTNTGSPSYVQIIKDQNRIKEDIKMVEDSIQSLAKRQFEMKTYVDEQLDIINTNNEKAIANLVERLTSQSASNQQFIMTSLNNLALIFDESLKQMQQQMAGKMQGNQSCNKPGGKGKPSMGNMSQMQKQLNDKLNEMQGQMKQGQKPGQQNSMGMSEQLAKMAAQQAAIRDALRQLNEQYNKDGKGSLGNLEQIQDLMDKTERDLANKTITNETIKRQQEILTRLLEAEKADQERETDNKRKSETAKDQTPSLPPSLQEYLNKRKNEVELYQTLPPDLKPYYRNITEYYFNQIPN